MSDWTHTEALMAERRDDTMAAIAAMFPTKAVMWNAGPYGSKFAMVGDVIIIMRADGTLKHQR